MDFRLPRWTPRATLLLALLLALPAIGQEPAAVPPAPQPTAGADLDEIRALVATLEDEARREELLRSLRALLTAQEQAAPPAPTTAEGAVAWLVRELEARTATAFRALRSAVDSLGQLPFLAIWLERQIADPAARDRWWDVTWRLGLLLAVALGGFLVASTALAGVRARLRAVAPERWPARLARALARLVIELVPVAVFAALAYGTMAALQPRLETRFVGVALITAIILARTGVALLRVVLAPRTPALRVVPLADEDAAFAYRWLRRLVAYGVYGYAALTAGRLLGLPATIHGVLLHLFVLFLAMLAVAMVLRARRRVASGLAFLDDASWGPVVRYVPWTAVAAIWHLLAVIWIAVFYLVWALGTPGEVLILVRATVLTLLIIALAWAALVTIERRLPPPEEPRPLAAEPGEEEDAPERPQSRLPTLRGLLRVAIAVVAALAVLEAWNLGTLRWLASEPGQAIGRTLLNIGLVLAIALGMWKGVTIVIARYLEAKDAQGNIKHSNRTRTLMTIARNALLVFVAVVSTMMVLSELGLDITPLLAGAGVIGLAIGFGSQKLVQDIITGLFILLGDTIRVGDVVNVAGRGGVVELVTLRAVRLRDYAGNVHTIPYSAIDSVTNMTKDFSFYVFDIGVAYREDVDEVIRVMREVGASLQRDPTFRRLILEPLEIAGVDAFADSAVMIKARIKTQPIRQWTVGREFNRRLKKRFDELGIEIPFPHRTLYFGADKAGQAPEAPVRVTYTASIAGDEAEPSAEAPPAPAERPAAVPRG